MIVLFIIIALLIAFLLISEKNKNDHIIKIISSIISAYFFYLLLYNVTYNTDWDIYEQMFNGVRDSTDFLFNFLSNWYFLNGYNYSSLYQLHIILMGIGFIYFVSRFSNSAIFVIILIYLIFEMIPLSNQIRYFVAFAFFLIAIYNFIITKNYVIFLIFAFLSVLSHLGILLFYPFLYFFKKYESGKYEKKILLYSLIIATTLYLLNYIGFVFSNNLDSYLDKDNISSLTGGIYNLLIWALWMFFIYLKQKRFLMLNSNIIEIDIKYQFLYKLSLYPILFIPIGLYVQIFAHRYIFASIIIWLTYFIYSLKFEESLFHKIKSIYIFLIVVFVTFVYIYILPFYLFGTSVITLHQELFNSNSTLQSFFQ